MAGCKLTVDTSFRSRLAACTPQCGAHLTNTNTVALRDMYIPACMQKGLAALVKVRAPRACLFLQADASTSWAEGAVNLKGTMTSRYTSHH